MDYSPRRSARLSPPTADRRKTQSMNSIPPRSSASTYSSTSTSSFPSPTNDTTGTAPPQLQLDPAYSSWPSSLPSDQMTHAPLPSPSAAEMGPFFGRSHSQPANPFVAQHQQPPQYQHQQAQAVQQNHATGPQEMGYHQQQPHHPHTNSFSQPGGMSGNNAATAPFLRDFNLVAEAAKRAEMACVMRDFGDVSL